MSRSSVRIGCASAFYGDSQLAARQLVDKGELDYLVFDYLAEVTMGILAKARARDERLGFAVDFVTVAMRDVMADCAANGIKIIANAGGVNVPGCIAALQSLAQEQGLQLNIAGVYGDDLLSRREEFAREGLSDMESGAPLPDKLASMNAYLGAQPIAEALAAGEGNYTVLDEADCEFAHQQFKNAGGFLKGGKDWAACLRLADRLDPSYKD